jgi:hypothetical protein
VSVFLVYIIIVSFVLKLTGRIPGWISNEEIYDCLGHRQIPIDDRKRRALEGMGLD